jgi:hypothetical protein
LFDLANFAQGAFYKFGVNVQSKGFSEAPDVVLKSMQRLKWAKEEACRLVDDWMAGLGVEMCEAHGSTLQFNECLLLGYMTTDAINVSRVSLTKQVLLLTRCRSIMTMERKMLVP